MSVSNVNVIFMLSCRKAASTGNLKESIFPLQLAHFMEESLCANLSIQKEYIHLLKMSEHTAEHFFLILLLQRMWIFHTNSLC